MADSDSRIKNLQHGLLPIMRIKGEDVRFNIDDRLTAYACPGVGVSVFEDGKLGWSAGFGVLEKGKAQSVTGDTLFAGASISKPVTAVLALQIVDQGVWDLDADVNGYLSTWKVPDNEFTRQSPVTLRWLLSHRAGTTVHGYGKMNPGVDNVNRGPTTLETLNGTPPSRSKPVTVDKVPGGVSRYSGGGTMIVQLMLEELTGQPFQQLAQERIFAPLNMTNTTFEQPLPARFHANTAVGHDITGESLPEKYTFSPELAPAGIYTSAADYARFMIACRDAWLGRSNPLLSQKIAIEMMTPQGQGEFGLGWIILGDGAERRFNHGGSAEGYQCESFCYLDSGKGAVVMTNAVSGLHFYWEVFNAIADANAWPGFMPEPKTVVPIARTDFPRYVGEYPIISGVDAPAFRLWDEDGVLMGQVIGLRGGAQPILMDENGRFFNRTGPYETEVLYNEAGRAVELIVRLGTTEILRAKRS